MFTRELSGHGRSEPDEGVDDDRPGEGDDPHPGASDQDERVVRGPVDREQDDGVQREQEHRLAAQLGRVARLAGGPHRPARPAEDELRRPVGDDHGAEHDHGHGGRGLLALEHHVQEHVDGRKRVAGAHAFAGAARLVGRQPIVELVVRRRRIVDVRDPVARVAGLDQVRSVRVSASHPGNCFVSVLFRVRGRIAKDCRRF